MATAKKKRPAKRRPSKKSPAKKRATRKAPAKRHTAKKKRTAKKSPARKRPAAKKRPAKRTAKKRPTKRNPTRGSTARRGRVNVTEVNKLAGKIADTMTAISREELRVADGKPSKYSHTKLARLRVRLAKYQHELRMGLGGTRRNPTAKKPAAKRKAAHSGDKAALATANRRLRAIEKKQTAQNKRIERVEKAQVLVKQSARDKINALRGL